MSNVWHAGCRLLPLGLQSGQSVVLSAPERAQVKPCKSQHLDAAHVRLLCSMVLAAMFILGQRMHLHISTACWTSTCVSVIALPLTLNMHQQQRHQHVTATAHVQPSTRWILAVLQVDDLLRGRHQGPRHVGARGRATTSACPTAKPGGGHVPQGAAGRLRLHLWTTPPPPPPPPRLPPPIRPPGVRQLKVRIFVDIFATGWVKLGH